jgi:threonine dehydratase
VQQAGRSFRERYTRRDRHVAGNHAQGVAYHAQRLGLRALIVMPRFTPGVKIERTSSFGAEVVLHGDTLDAARAHALELAEREGLTFVHPYDDEAIIAGQGTVALEMLDAVPDLDTLVVAVGGGGLIAAWRWRRASAGPTSRSSACRPRAFRQHGERGQGHAPCAGQEHHRRRHRGRHARAC